MNKSLRQAWALKPFIAIALVLAALFWALAQTSQPLVNHQATAQAKPEPPDFEHDITERCKDYIFFRNKLLVLHRQGNIAGADKARSAMNQYYDDLLKYFTAKEISATIDKLEKKANKPYEGN